MCLCLIIEEFEIVCSFVPLAVVFVFSWAWGDVFVLWELESLICLFPDVLSTCVLLLWLLKLFVIKVYIAFFMDIRSWTNLMGSYCNIG